MVEHRPYKPDYRPDMRKRLGSSPSSPTPMNLDLVSTDVASRLIREANKEERETKHHMRHAAVILDRSFRPICYGYNRFDRHAEGHAISKLLNTPHFRGKKPYAILVVRVNKTNKFVGSKPCQKCQRLIDAVGLKAFHT